MDTRRSLLFICLLSFLAHSGCQRAVDEADAETLLQEIESHTEEFQEADISVVIHDLSTGVTVERDSDQLMPAGALLHLPTLIETYRQAAAGHLSLLDTLHLEPHDLPQDTLITPAEEDTLLAPPSPPALVDLISEMMTTSSDSAAADLLTVISPDSVALTSSRMGATGVSLWLTPDTTTALVDSINAGSVLTLLNALAQGRAVNPRMDHDILTLMLRHQNRSMIPAGLPPDVSVAHLTARGPAYHHDAAIVYPRTGGPYLLIIMTSGLREEESAAAGAAITRTVHRRLRGGPTD